MWDTYTEHLDYTIKATKELKKKYFLFSHIKSVDKYIIPISNIAPISYLDSTFWLLNVNHSNFTTLKKTTSI